MPTSSQAPLLFLTALLLPGVLGACHKAPVDPPTLDEPETTVVWESGMEGYHTYRIPVVIATPQGTLLAFAEGRRGGQGDAGDIDLLLKRSVDGGQTWSAAQVVCDIGTDTCGNPAPVVDRQTGSVHLLLTWNRGTDRENQIMDGTSEDVRRAYYTRSDDEGETWIAPRDISATTRESDWRWYATGPVHGIQLAQERFKGRLVIPANHSVPHEETGPHTYRSHVLFSDDGGATWALGGVHEPYTNESTVVELSDGALLQNMRSYHGEHRRAVATSIDGGATWSPVRLDTTLVEPVCQASLLRYRASDAEHPHGILLFSNPASTSRDHLTVRASFDDGLTWPVHRLVYEGAAAYSSLVKLPDERIGLLFERDGYEEIVLTTFSLDWLLAER